MAIIIIKHRHFELFETWFFILIKWNIKKVLLNFMYTVYEQNLYIYTLGLLQHQRHSFKLFKSNMMCYLFKYFIAKECSMLRQLIFECFVEVKSHS